MDQRTLQEIPPKSWNCKRRRTGVASEGARRQAGKSEVFIMQWMKLSVFVARDAE